MKTKKIFLVTFLAIGSWTSNAHELATHAAITYNAFLKSKLNPSGTLVQDLGILNFMADPGTSSNPFGTTYFDIQGVTNNERQAQPFEKKIIGQDLRAYNVNELTLPGWLMRGAIREDDLGTTFGFNNGDDPHDDPYGSIQRVFNHFFDPVNNRPLTVLGISAGEKNPDWAIGTNNAFATPIAENASRRNHFTFYDARG